MREEEADLHRREKARAELQECEVRELRDIVPVREHLLDDGTGVDEDGEDEGSGEDGVKPGVTRRVYRSWL